MTTGTCTPGAMGRFLLAFRPGHHGRRTTSVRFAELRSVGLVPVYQPPPPPPVLISAWTWTGCYIGGHFGGLWAGRKSIDVTPVGPFFGSDDHNINGGLAGVQAGCDYQFASGWVIGI